MMRRLLAVLILLPAALQAQERFGTRLDWGNVEVVLYPSQWYGTQFALTAASHRSFRQWHDVVAGFAPDTVFTWLNAAQLVVHPPATPRDTLAVLVTPVLRSASGDSIRFLRRPKGRRWNERVAILLDAGGRFGEHFDVMVRPQEADALLAGLQREAGLSGYDPDSVVKAVNDSGSGSSTESIDEPPAVVTAGIPRNLEPPIRGNVTLQFVVLPNGRVEPASIKPILADDLRLVPPARAAVLESRFRPAQRRGQAVPVMVRQQVIFRP